MRNVPVTAQRKFTVNPNIIGVSDMNYGDIAKRKQRGLFGAFLWVRDAGKPDLCLKRPLLDPIASSADYKVPDNVTQHGDTAVVRIEMEAIRALPDEEISATSDIIGADWRPRAHRATVHIPGMCGTHQE